MVNPLVRKQLLARLRVTKQALSLRAKKIKDTYGPMTTEEAVYVIAHLEGIDLSRILPLSLIDRIRALVPRSYTASGGDDRTPRATRKPSVRKPAPTKPYPLIKSGLMAQSIAIGADLFPLVFQLENSIRELILKRLATQDPKWWDNKVPLEVQRDIAKTMGRETRYPYRDKRGNHPLFYANFTDLKKIIVARAPDFADVLLDIDWFRVKMDEVYMARNNLAHCVPLTPDDAARISLFYRDWARLLDSAGIK